MTMTHLMRMAGITFVLSMISVAQQQQQSPPQSQPQQQQQQTQGQPQQKQSAWQRLKKAAQAAQQMSNQQGQQTQGTQQQQQQQLPMQQPVQQGAQGVQQGTQGVQQGMQGMQQPGMQQVAPGQQQMMGQGAGACGPSCFDAGPFQANVSQMTMSQQGGWHIIRMNMQFHNSSNQPLIIAYHEGSMVMVDNDGNTYVPAGGNPGEVQGMGIDRGNQTDSQFVLGPGQTGNALFSVARGRGPTSAVGTAYSYNLTIDELQPQNGAMAIPVRTYNLNFASLSPSGVGGISNFATTAPATGATTGAYANGGKAAAVGGVPSRTNQQVARPVNARAANAQPVNGQVVNAQPANAQTVNGQAMNVQRQPTGAMVPAAAKSPIPTTAARPAAPAVRQVAPARPAPAPANAAAQNKKGATTTTTNTNTK